MSRVFRTLSGDTPRPILQTPSAGHCLFRKVHFLETLENLEILETLENPQNVENKGESGHFLEILENLDRGFRDSREFRGFRDSRDSSTEKAPFVMAPFSGPDLLRTFCKALL